MRILFTFIGRFGHFPPLAPVARAAEAAGHEVAVAGLGGLVARVAAAGFRAFATSAPHTRATDPPRRDMTSLFPVDMRAAEVEFAENFADKGARRHATAIQEHIREWRPDVVVREEADFGSAIAAEVLGIPTATFWCWPPGCSCAQTLSQLHWPPFEPSTAYRRIPASPCSRAAWCCLRSRRRSAARLTGAHP